MHSTQRTGPVTWRTRASRASVPWVRRRASDVAGDGELGVVEGQGREVGGEGVLRGLHEGAVEGGADLEHDGALGSGLLAEVGGALDGCGRAGDDGLVGGVEVGGRDDGAVGVEGLGFGRVWKRGELVGDLGADVGMSVGVEAEDRGHCAFSGGDGLLHVSAAGADGADGVGEGEGSGGDVGGVFAEGVAGGEGGVMPRSARTRWAATETVRIAGWVCSVSLSWSSGPSKMSFERAKPRASSASSKTARAMGKLS